MKLQYLILGLLTSTLLGIISYNITHSFFNGSAASTNNIFAASDQFPTQTAQVLVINEVLPTSHCDLGGGKNAAWIELWNGFSSTVDLKDFKLNDGVTTVDIVNSNTLLASHDFALLSKDNSIWTQCFTAATGSATINLGSGSPIDLNTGILRLIASDSATVIDRVEFATASPGLKTLPDQSIERIALGHDTATGDTFNPADFSVQCPSTPGTWSAPTGICGVVINELMWMGTSTSSADEFLELRNLTSNPVNLTNWKIKGAATSHGTLTIPSGTLPANGLFLISNNATSSSAIAVNADLTTSSLELPNTDAQYVLLNNLGSVVDTADDGSGVPLAGSNGTPKESMERNLIPGDGFLVGSWHTASTSANFKPGVPDKGTPKVPND